MHLSQIQVEHFRNLASQLVPLAPKINLVTGANGAGKTALLEAIHFLGRQKSFRTAKPKELIQEGQDYFRLIAKTIAPEHQIGLERRLDSDRQLAMLLRIDRQTQQSPAYLSKILPTIAITSRSFQLIDAGPLYRRQFIDYGAFHFDTAFLKCLQHYDKSLKSRNAALKQKLPREVIQSFTPIMANSGEQIHRIRLAYFSVFKPLLTKHLTALDFPYAVSLRYAPGWNTEFGLSETLDKHFDYDYRLSHTRYGPHRADLRFSINGGNADNRLSRGQQKNLILAMYLAQIDLIAEYGATAPLLIFDDIAAELDAERRNVVFAYLMQFDCQMFFSATEATLFASEIRQQAALIHLAGGTISAQ